MNLHKAESAFVKSVAKGGTMQESEKNYKFLQAHHRHFHISSFPFQVRQCSIAKYALNFHFQIYLRMIQNSNIAMRIKKG